MTESTRIENEHDRISRELADAHARAGTVALMTRDPAAQAKADDLGRQMQAENDRYHRWASAGRTDPTLYWDHPA